MGDLAGKVAIVTIALSPAHNIIDICDDMAGTYEAGELPREGLPPYHTNCLCETSVKTKKK